MNALFPMPVAKEVVLRPHQTSAEQRIRERMVEGARRIILVAPTAFGKTETALDLILKSQTKQARVWFVVDRKTLVDQTSERFAQYGIDHGVIQADHWLTAPDKRVQIVSVQTAIRRQFADDFLPNLVIVDEAHCEYKDFLKFLAERCPRARVIGLTATPFTDGMADHWDALVNGATTNQLLADGWLTPLKIKACVTPDMKGVRKVAGEYEDGETGRRGITIIGDVVHTWVEQVGRYFGGPVKTIVFSPSVEHGAELCRQFAAAGYNFQQISYLDANDKDRRDKIEEFRKSDSAIDGLVSCAVLTKGFDVPDVLCGISCRPSLRQLRHLRRGNRVALGTRRR